MMALGAKMYMKSGFLGTKHASVEIENNNRIIIL